MTPAATPRQQSPQPVDPRLDIATRGVIVLLLGVCSFFLYRTYTQIDEMRRELTQHGLRLYRIEARLGIPDTQAFSSLTAASAWPDDTRTSATIVPVTTTTNQP